MCELEIVLHHGLYEAVQVGYKDYLCEINTHGHGDCVTVHLMLKGKSGSVISSVGKYRIGVNTDDFYKQMIGELN